MTEPHKIQSDFTKLWEPTGRTVCSLEMGEGTPIQISVHIGYIGNIKAYFSWNRALEPHTVEDAVLNEIVHLRKRARLLENWLLE